MLCPLGDKEKADPIVKELAVRMCVTLNTSPASDETGI